jgi:hypothetical protein
MDLTACYALPGLRLQRRVILDRHAPEVLIEDTVAGCSAYELPLLFAVEPVQDDGAWRLGDIRLDTALAGEVERLDLRAERVMSTSWPGGLWRLRLRALVPPGGMTVRIVLHPRG